MPVGKNHAIEKAQQNDDSRTPFKEVHQEIDYGPDRIHLILQLPPMPSPPRPTDALRQEIRAILSRELSGKALL